MDILEQLREYGTKLGYEGQDLRDFIREQQVSLRDERAAAREKEKDERDHKFALESAELEREKQAQELKLKEIEHAHKLELLEKQAALKIKGEVIESHDSTFKPRGPKIPAFDDGKDEMDSYLRRFERYSEAQKWDKSVWATHLSALLEGKALDVYALLPSEQALDYDALKTALLKRYDLTEDGFKRKFRACRPESGETFVQFSVRLESYFLKWLEMSKIEGTFVALCDLMLRDQFIHVCSRELSLFLKERTPKNLGEMAGLADQYREARFTSSTNLTSKGSLSVSQQMSRNSTTNPRPKPGVSTQDKGQERRTNTFIPKSERRCYKCNKIGHIASECNPRFGKVNSLLSQTTPVSQSSSGAAEIEDSSPQEFKPGTCGACILTSDTISSTTIIDNTTTLTSACQDIRNINMPISAGYVNGKAVTVLRDNGCSGIVIRKSYVTDDQLKPGKFQSCILADGTLIKAPIASIFIDTPYLQGHFDAWCMEAPVYDLIIGNVDTVREPGKPDPSWKPICAVETRQQVKAKGKYQKMKVPDIVKDEISPSDIKKAQEVDRTLNTIRDHALKENQIKSGKCTVRWFMKNGLIYREYISHQGGDNKVFHQLVVPLQYREAVMRLAHESIMSGHMGIRRTVCRVLSEFYWPGVQADTKRFCQSCDICQRTLSKGRLCKVPLGDMPLIEEPFRRVAVDIVGPIKPATDRGNRYILTLMDYATRYPEAIALKGIEAERVAEALVDIFCRVGVPKEMLTDMGSQFTSTLMSEVSRLISMKQLTTTPYHPMCNGLIERFNGTLKQMLKRLCTEKPKDWDKYLNAVLFAYREVPQESLGFSPFELVYGRSVRGPMTILKELWTQEIDDSQVKSTYQYVIDLREKLETTCELARENLEKATRRHKKYYNKGARDRNMKVGDKVLVLLSSDSNKLLLQWKGPYTIVEKFNKVDYRIDMDGKVRTFHANMLKRYIERTESSHITHDASDTTATLVSAVVIDNNDFTEDDGIIHELPSDKSVEGPDDVDVNPELTLEQLKQVREMLIDNKDVLTDLPGKTNLLDIKTTTDRPIKAKPNQIPYAMIDVVNEEVDKMLKLGIIEPSDSPYSSNVVLVKKKDGTYRFCINFIPLNSISLFDSEPMPNAEEMFSKMSGNFYFSRLDMSKGYWQVPLEESAKTETAFQTPKGLFNFLVMPFGLITAGATFTRLMRKLLHGMKSIDNFIDDIIIYTVTFEQHMAVLLELFLRLRTAKLRVKPSKCALFYSSLECLGHCVGTNQPRPHPDKVKAIEEAPRPTTKKQVRSFLGLVGFYRKFVPNFSHVAAPLSDLTKKGMANKISWETAQEYAYQNLKKALTSSPILKLPDMSKPFILMLLT